MAQPTEHTVVLEDRPCVHCGYNLRGLDRTGRCPECFTSLDPSLRSDLLNHADEQWLDRLRLGTVLKLWNLVVGLVVGIAAVVMLFTGLPRWLIEPLGWVAGGMGLWASFLITTQEPRISLQEDTVTWRKVIRICAVAAFTGQLLQGVGKGTSLTAALLTTGHILTLAGVVSLFGELLYFRRFALRIPEPRLANSTRVVMWGSTICLALLIGATIVGAILGFVPGGMPAAGGAPLAGPPGVAGIAVTALFCVVFIPGAVFFIWHIFLLFEYKKAFTTAAAESRAMLAGSGELGDEPPGPIASKQ